MRVYGRVYDINGNPTWTVVETDANGHSDMVYVTALVQWLKLNYGESPMYGTAGIPARESVVQQVFPDYFVRMAQQKFTSYFASLLITKESSTTPTYDIKIMTNSGVRLNLTVAVPT